MSVLSRIRIDHQTAAQCRLNDSYAWHKALWKAFPNLGNRNFLYRVEPQDNGFLVYLLSEAEPEKQAWGRWESKTVGDAFLGHSSYRFQLCANPTVKRKVEGRKNGTRTAICDPEELKAWLVRKAEQGGFSVDESALRISPAINQPFRKNGKHGNHKRVEFQGILRVAQPEPFKETFKKGIGSAKAFGFGLLVLQPIHS
ncbi:MAG: type I-E CRISPR-associated protein Cas6/Cse3/CasE [Verrucomicrobia bacterium]|nr:MAG: type I-E CRISPR-associated protein Cas6/Cse3/CasE [Verrucomicrobiota bacterium]